jgi:hypothetical protein
MGTTDRRTHIEEWAQLLDASVPDALADERPTDRENRHW